MASNDAQMEATMSGMVGPYMTPLARTPLALIRRKPVRSVSGAVCPHCGRGMVEACCPSCKKGGPCEGSKKRKKSWPKTRRGPKKKINGKEARGVLIAWLTAYGYKRDYRATKDVWINASETKRVTFKRAVVVFEKGKRGEWERNYKVMRHGEPLSTIKTATSLYNTIKKSLGEAKGVDRFLDSLDNDMRKWLHSGKSKVRGVHKGDKLIFTDDNRGRMTVVEKQGGVYMTSPRSALAYDFVKGNMSFGEKLMGYLDFAFGGPVFIDGKKQTWVGMFREGLGEGEGAGAVPNCTPLQPPDPNCTLTRGWKDEMKRKLKKFKKRSPRRRL